MSYDMVVRDALIVDGTGSTAFGGDLAIEDGRIVAVGMSSGTADADDRRRRPGRRSRVHRCPHPLRRPAHLGPERQPLERARGHDRPDGELRLHARTGAPGDQDYLMGLFAAAEEVPKAALQRYGRSHGRPSPIISGTSGAAPSGSTCWLRSGTALCAASSWARGQLSARPPQTRSPPWSGSRKRRWTPGPSASAPARPRTRWGVRRAHPLLLRRRRRDRGPGRGRAAEGQAPLLHQPASEARRPDRRGPGRARRLAEVSGAVVSWNDFGMGTPGGRACSSSWRPSCPGATRSTPSPAASAPRPASP